MIYSESKCLGAYAVTRRVFSKIFAVLILLFFTCGYVFVNSGNVLAMASVSSGSGQAWGSTGQIPIYISNASAGETITCTVTVDGTLTRCFDSLDHEGTVSGSSIYVKSSIKCCVFKVNLTVIKSSADRRSYRR